MPDPADFTPVEEWRPIPGYEEFYEVSNLGRVRSLRIRSKVRLVPKVLSPGRSREGYRTVTLRGWGTGVHRLVLLAFVGPPPSPEYQAAHQDHDPGNNRLDNLKWMTPLANTRMQRERGTTVCGEKQGQSRFTADDIREMRAMAERGVKTWAIADHFHTWQRTVADIIERKAWRHIE